MERSMSGGDSRPGVTVRRRRSIRRLEFRKGRTRRFSGRNRHLWRRTAFLVLANGPEKSEELWPMTLGCENNLAI
jgi:hypothetical protein